ncbi:HIT family protein [Tautonia plasticadhaerens]|uniref:HIT-like protein n=1 Tax=Tautonia plasticadhaerens TaxID=2527974 RepID=A0A518GUG0_9BACT|nr:HIT family protein [Tautonia plasticadhaerens]QDV32216.1 HIT-like protein [Tautonia plasticadhaerens]
MAYDPQNVFARILRGEIPAAKVLETDGALAFLDVGPVNKGHLLIVPKAEAATLSDLPDDVSAHVGSLLPRLCRAVKQATGADGLNVIVNHGEVAGQSVHHVHWHIVPRFKDDAFRWPWPQQSYSGDEAEQMRDRIRHALGDGES